MGLQLLSMVVIARLLTPSAIGIFGAGAAIVAIISSCADLGQADYLVKQPEQVLAIERNAYGLSLLLSVIVAIVTIAIVMMLPTEDNQLGWVVIILALSAMLEPLSLIMRARLSRDLQFDRLLRLGVARDVALVCGNIGFVLAGFQALALALALGLLAGQLVMVAAACWYHRQMGWLRPALNGDLVQLCRFGLLRVSLFGLSTAGLEACRLVISWLLGFVALGLLDRAEKVTRVLNDALLSGLLPVLLPFLSQAIREQSNVGQAWLNKQRYVAALAWPFFLFLALAADPVVAVLLGPQWTAAVAVVQVLCLSAIMLPVSFGAFRFLIALDLLREFLPFQIVTQFSAVVVAIIGSQFSIEVACLGFVTLTTLTGIFAAVCYDSTLLSW